MINIQKAKATDALEIKALLFKTWTQAYSTIYSPEQIKRITSIWHAKEFLEQQIQDPKMSFLVATDENKIVGMCNAYLMHENTINIQKLHVDPNYQRQGVGTKLMQETIKSYPKAEAIELEVEEQNQKAYKFYQKKGYRKIGKKNFEVDGITIQCLVMQKEI